MWYKFECLVTDTNGVKLKITGDFENRQHAYMWLTCNGYHVVSITKLDEIQI